MEKEKSEMNEDGKGNAEERLELISQSVKSVALMTNVGISFCLVIPGYGVRDDVRLTSNSISPGTVGRVASTRELGENFACMLYGFMDAMRKQGLPDSSVYGIVDEVVKQAKKKYKLNQKSEIRNQKSDNGNQKSGVTDGTVPSGTECLQATGPQSQGGENDEGEVA